LESTPPCSKQVPAMVHSTFMTLFCWPRGHWTSRKQTDCPIHEHERMYVFWVLTPRRIITLFRRFGKSNVSTSRILTLFGVAAEGTWRSNCVHCIQQTQFQSHLFPKLWLATISIADKDPPPPKKTCGVPREAPQPAEYPNLLWVLSHCISFFLQQAVLWNPLMTSGSNSDNNCSETQIIETRGPPEGYLPYWPQSLHTFLWHGHIFSSQPHQQPP
jgi:hypothetical protein